MGALCLGETNHFDAMSSIQLWPVGPLLHIILLSRPPCFISFSIPSTSQRPQNLSVKNSCKAKSRRLLIVFVMWNADCWGPTVNWRPLGSSLHCVAWCRWALSYLWYMCETGANRAVGSCSQQEAAARPSSGSRIDLFESQRSVVLPAAERILNNSSTVLPWESHCVWATLTLALLFLHSSWISLLCCISAVFICCAFILPSIYCLSLHSMHMGKMQGVFKIVHILLY